MYNNVIARKGVPVYILIFYGGWSLGATLSGRLSKQRGNVWFFEDVLANQGVVFMDIGSSPPVVIMDIIANIKEK